MEDNWEKLFTFLVEGVLMFLVGCLGLVGNVFSVALLLKQKVRKTFHNLLLLLCWFDMVYITSAIVIFSLPKLGNIFLGTFQMVTSPVMSPLAHIGMVGSIYTTLAISLERYLAVVYPFSQFRSNHSSRHFLIPVLLYSILYNIPKFFELKVSCSEDSWAETRNEEDLKLNLTTNTGLDLTGTNMSCSYRLEGRSFRKLKKYYKYFEENFRCEVIQSYSGLRNEKLIRKREVVNSHVCLYIAVVTFLCHSIRLVPTLWEMHQRFGLDPEEYPWPAWLEVVTVLSHLALTLSASISPYILPALYRANRNTRQQADLSERRGLSRVRKLKEDEKCPDSCESNLVTDSTRP